MEVWTEVLGEELLDVHIGTREVLVPMDDDLTEYQITEVINQLERRRAHEQQRKHWRELARDMEERREAREQLRSAGYTDDEIPL